MNLAHSYREQKPLFVKWYSPEALIKGPQRDVHDGINTVGTENSSQAIFRYSLSSPIP